MYGDDEDWGAYQKRCDGGVVFPVSMNIGQTSSQSADYYTNGVYAGVLSCSLQVIDTLPVTVPAGTFSDCVHVRLTITKSGNEPGVQVKDEWWARGVGPVKKQGISGPGSGLLWNLISYTIPSSSGYQSDTFSGTTVNGSIWQLPPYITGNGALTQNNGLFYHNNGSGVATDKAFLFSQGVGSTTADWSVWMDAQIPSLSKINTNGQKINLVLELWDNNNSSNRYLVEMSVNQYDEWGKLREIHHDFCTGGNWVEDRSGLLLNFAGQPLVSLGVSWQASTKTLSTFYAPNGGGTNWILLGSFNLGAGSTNAWNLNPAQGFGLSIGGYSINISLATNDNVLITGFHATNTGMSGRVRPKITTILGPDFSPLPSAALNSAYSQALQATNGAMPYTWSVCLGSLPVGLSLGTNSGTISGTPTTVGTNRFAVQVTGADGAYSMATYSITVSSGGGSLHVNLLPAAAVVAGAQWQVDNSGVWRTNNATVSGLSVGSHTVGFSNITGWTSPTNRVVSIASGVTTNPTVSYGASITTLPTLPSATAGASYNATLQTTNATGLLSWGVVAGSLPPGINFANGVLSGTPTTAGAYNFTLQVADLSAGTMGTNGFTLTVLATSDMFAGSFTVPRAYDNSNKDGVTLNHDDIVVNVQRLNSTHLSVSVSNAVFSILPVVLVQTGVLARLETKPLNMPGFNLLDMALLSDGSNRAIVWVTQNKNDPLDMSFSVAAWSDHAGATIADDYVGHLVTDGYSSPNLRGAATNFTYSLSSGDAVKTGPTSFTILGGSSEGHVMSMTVGTNGADLVNAPSNHHAFHMISDGTGGAYYQVTSEIYDPTDVSVGVGLGVRSSVPTGSLSVTINPAGAVSAGAQWQVDSNGVWQTTGATVANLTAGNHTVGFKAVAGWVAPADQVVGISSGQTTPLTGTYTVAVPVKAQMLSPTNGTTFTSSSVTFVWSGTVGTQYALWVGNSVGGQEISTGLESGLSRTVTVPTDGRRICVRLLSWLNGGWQYNDYSYTAARTLGFVGLGSWLPSGTWNGSYSQTLQAIGGAGSYAWSWSGNTPPGMSLSAAGVLSGRPTVVGTYNFTIRVSDGANAVSQSVSITILGVDVSYATVSKVQHFWQTNAGAAVLPPASLEVNPFGFEASLKQAAAGTITSATLRQPNATTRALTTPPPPTPYATLGFTSYFATKAALDAAFTNGSHTFTIIAAHDGTNALAVTLPADSYPTNAPHISNWTAAQTVNAALGFTLTWDALAGATSNDFVSVALRNWFSGAPGTNDVFHTAAWGSAGALCGTNTLALIPAGTLTTNQTYLAEVSWWKPGALNTTNYLGAVGAGGYAKTTKFFINTTSPAQMLSPTPGATLTNATTIFTWSSGRGVTAYALWVGNAAGTNDIYAATEPGLTRTLTLPADGRQLYVRLWSTINGTLQYNDYNYTAYKAVKARLTGLSNGAALGSSSVTFAWDAGAGASQYRLWVGSSVGGQDIYAGTQTGLSRTLTLPADGRSLYVTLASLINGTWQSNNYVFTACTTPLPVRAQMLSPANGTTLPGASVTFIWDSGTGVTTYMLWAGRTPSGNDLWSSPSGTNRSCNVTGLPTDGSPIYVTLWSWINGAWQSNGYTYSAYLAGAAAKARMSSPANGAALTAPTTTFVWNRGSAASQYTLWVGSNTNSSNLFNANVGTNLSQVVSVPATGAPVYVRLWSLISSAWQYNDYSYTAPGPAKAQMLSPANGGTFSSTSVPFSWNSGMGVTTYGLCAGTAPSSTNLVSVTTGTNRSCTVTNLPSDGSPVYVALRSYLNGSWQTNTYTYKAWTAGGAVKASMTSPANSTTLTSCSTTFGWDTGVGVSQYALWVGSTPSSYGIYQSLESGLSRTVTLPATGAPIYVRLLSWVNSAWRYSDYTYTTPAPAKAQMQSPVSGTTLAGPSVTFSWDAGTGATSYKLWVGSAPSSYDLDAITTGASRSCTVPDLPTDGEPIYVTLWSLINGVWQSNAYIYLANGP